MPLLLSFVSMFGVGGLFATQVLDVHGVAFLASDRASFVTGEDVRVDGGLLAGLAVVLPD